MQTRLHEESTALNQRNYAVEQKLATLRFRLFERSLSQIEMRKSLSWRITKPLREITRFSPNFKTQTNEKSLTASKPPAIIIQCSNGKTIYANPKDERALALENHSGNFNPSSLAMWQKILTTQAWTDIVDVGANYGEMLLNIEPPPSAAFIAVEPNPNVFPFLKKSLNEAGLKVTLIKEALSSKQGHANLLLNHSWSGMSGIMQAQAGTPHHSTSAHKVKVTTLDCLLNDKKRQLCERKILIKVDVEGHELEVLAGATKTLKNCANFAIQVEVLHLDESQLQNLLHQFKILINQKSKNSFTEIDSTSLSDFHQYLKDGDHYNQDVILTKRNEL